MNPRNFSIISFPFLGLELNPPRTFAIGPVNIHFYGLIIAVAMLLAVAYTTRRSKEFGVTEDHILDGVLWVTPLAIVCARAYYCIFAWHEFAADPISVLYIWNGGIAIYGGVIGAVLGIALLCRIKKVKVTPLLDLILMTFLMGQALGRWGNFFNREAFGAETDSFFRMGLFNTVTGETTYYHPTFLYESLWNITGFVLLHFFSKRRKYDGQIALCYVAWYGLGRCMIEGLRMDSLWWGPFRVSQLLAGGSCVIALAILGWQALRPHDPAKLYVNQVAAKQATEPEKAEAQPKEDAQ